MRISDWSSDVCSSDLTYPRIIAVSLSRCPPPRARPADRDRTACPVSVEAEGVQRCRIRLAARPQSLVVLEGGQGALRARPPLPVDGAGAVAGFLEQKVGRAHV